MSLEKSCQRCKNLFIDKTKSHNKKYCSKLCFQKSFQEKYYNSPKGRYVLAKRCFTSKRGLRKGKKFLLSVDEYWDKTSVNECHYCEGPLSKSGLNLDRIDPNKDYTNENTVPCCPSCNTLKFHNLTYEETILIVNLLKKLRGKKWIWS